jgi:hypothetical protein
MLSVLRFPQTSAAAPFALALAISAMQAAEPRAFA